MRIELDWKEPEDRRMLGKEAFFAIDPGVDGAVLAFHQGKPIDYAAFDDTDRILKLAQTYKIRGVVMEAQYTTSMKNARAINRLSFQSGVLVGLLEATVGSVVMVQVAPSTWQAAQRPPGMGKLSRKEGIEFSMAQAKPFTARWGRTKKLREGVASAYGIGCWWVSLEDGS